MPNVKCAVINCTNSIVKGENKISFFKFPMNIPKLLEKWVAATNRANWAPTSSSRICQLHFNSNDFSKSTTKVVRLKADAIPTLNLNIGNCDTDIFYNKENMERTNVLSVLENESAQIDLTEPNKMQKRKAIDTLESVKIKCRKMDDEKKELKTTIQSLKESYKKQLNIQADMFRTLIEKEKNMLREKLSKEKKKFVLLKKRNSRRDKKIESLIEELKKTGRLNEEAHDIVSLGLNSISSKLIANENKNKKSKGRRYSEDEKRTMFTLPHPSSMRNWMSNVNIKPGFILQVLQVLSKLQEKEKDCCLMLDSMAIREQLTWNEEEHKYIGFCDYGDSICLENNDVEAHEALVFLLVSLKGTWKWPIAYFLVKKTSSTILSQLIRDALIICFEHNLCIHSVTFDGDATNCSAMNILGAQIFAEDYTKIKHFFTSPTDDTKNIKIILDPCHMIKLARNALADYKQFQSDDGFIKWDYIVKLNTLQKQLTFKLKNRLSSQCINWQQNKMKVKYAVHVLSSSVANALEFLEVEGLEEFQDCSATVKFLRKIDRLFDILNCRNPFGKGYKTPIFKNNIVFFRNTIDDIIKYLFSLKTIDGKPLYRSGRKTFIYGLTIAARSILDVSEEIFKNNDSFKYILSYKFSQDHLEILFSKIRARHGFNNNPTCQQVKYALRQILQHVNINTSINSNCFEFDTEHVTSIFPLMWKKKHKENIFNSVKNNDLENDDLENDDLENDEYSDFSKLPLKQHDKITEYIIYYIAGYIVKQIKYLNCSSCILSLRQIVSEHNYTHEETFSVFVNFCNYGGLVKPSTSVFYICKETEKELQILTDQFSKIDIKNMDTKVITKVKNILTFDKKIFPNLQCENVSLTEMPHKIQLIITICKKYLKIRLHSFSKFYQQEILKPIRKRHKLTKQILFLRE